MNRMQTIVSTLIIGCAVAGLMSLGACSSSPSIPDAGAMPAGGTFSGLWYSPQFEHMYLHQRGNKVEGAYAYGSGGRLQGEVQGNMLVFTWEEPGDRQAARRDMRGKGYLQLTMVGGEPELRGQWGYNEAHAGAGPWEAEFVRERQDGDPTTIEGVLERH